MSAVTRQITYHDIRYLAGEARVSQIVLIGSSNLRHRLFLKRRHVTSAHDRNHNGVNVPTGD